MHACKETTTAITRGTPFQANASLKISKDIQYFLCEFCDAYNIESMTDVFLRKKEVLEYAKKKENLGICFAALEGVFSQYSPGFTPKYSSKTSDVVKSSVINSREDSDFQETSPIPDVDDVPQLESILSATSIGPTIASSSSHVSDSGLDSQIDALSTSQAQDVAEISEVTSNSQLVQLANAVIVSQPHETQQPVEEVDDVESEYSAPSPSPPASQFVGGPGIPLFDDASEVHIDVCVESRNGDVDINFENTLPAPRPSSSLLSERNIRAKVVIKVGPGTGDVRINCSNSVPQ